MERSGPVSGREWIVEAHGCDPVALAHMPTLARLFRTIVRDLALREVRPPVWHRFPGPAGITGISLLAESHLAVHTFPEHGSACLNLFCCVPRPEWDFAEGLREALAASHVEVRVIERRYVTEAVR